MVTADRVSAIATKYRNTDAAAPHFRLALPSAPLDLHPSQPRLRGHPPLTIGLLDGTRHGHIHLRSFLRTGVLYQYAYKLVPGHSACTKSTLKTSQEDKSKGCVWVCVGDAEVRMMGFQTLI